MIPINELRVGNLIKDSRGNEWPIAFWEHRDKVLSKTRFNKWGDIGTVFHEYVDKLQPIQLTENRLKRFGFLIRNHWAVLGDITLGYITKDDCFQLEVRFGLGGSKIIDVLYVHQLQNIVFYLTGAELELQN